MNSNDNNSEFNITYTQPEQARELTSPRVPDAIYDEDYQGLLPVSLLTQPLTVEFELWNDLRRGDNYQLLWDDELIGNIKTITTEQPGARASLKVPVELMNEGVHSIAYRVTDPENSVHTDSTSVIVEIDMTAPGLPELGPMKFPDEIADGLTSAELAGLGDQLIARIGSYAGIYQQDVIRTFWGDREGPGAVVSKTEEGLNRIEVIYTRTFLQSLGDFDGFVTYTVEDRAGNVSAPSLGTQVRLLLNNTLECGKKPAHSDKSDTAQLGNATLDISVHMQSTFPAQAK